jgi:hypothetical protein
MLHCRVVASADEMQAVFKLRYRIFYEEHGREPDDCILDHQTKTLTDDLDRRPSTVIVAVFDGNTVVGTTRQVVFTAQDFEQTDASHLKFINNSLHLEFFRATRKYTAMDASAVLYGGRTCVHPEFRKNPQVLPLLFREAYGQPHLKNVYLYFTCSVTGFLNTTYAAGYMQCGSPNTTNIPRLEF